MSVTTESYPLDQYTVYAIILPHQALIGGYRYGTEACGRISGYLHTGVGQGPGDAQMTTSEEGQNKPLEYGFAQGVP